MRVPTFAILFIAAALAARADPADPSLATDARHLPGGQVEYADGTIPFGCDAYEESSRQLTLVEVVRFALCSNLQTRKAWAEIASKSAALELAQSQYWPTVNGTLNSGFKRQKVGVEDFAFYGSDSDEKGYGGSLELNWMVYDFGLTPDKNRSARFALRAAIASRQSAVQSVTLAAVQAFFDVLDAESTLAAQKQAEAYAQESFSSAKSRFEAGMAVLTDRLQAQTAFSDARVKRITAEGDLRSARGKLAVIIGRMADTPLEVDPSDDVPPDATFLVSVEALMTEAKLNNPDLETARAAVESAAADLEAARVDSLPTISINAQIREDVERADSASSEFGTPSALPGDNTTRGRSVQLRIAVPLFSGFSHRAHAHDAWAAADQAVATLEDTERQVTLQVWTSYQAVRTGAESYAATIELLANAKESYEAARGRYDAGVGTVIDLLNAQAELVGADMQRIKALSSWRIAKSKLAASLGTLQR